MALGGLEPFAVPRVRPDEFPGNRHLVQASHPSGIGGALAGTGLVDSVGCGDHSGGLGQHGQVFEDSGGYACRGWGGEEQVGVAA